MLVISWQLCSWFLFVECQFKPVILNAEVSLDHGRLLPSSQEGDEGTVTCKPGYLSADSRSSYRIICSKYGMWTTLSGSSFQQCDSKQDQLSFRCTPFDALRALSIRILSGRVAILIRWKAKERLNKLFSNKRFDKDKCEGPSFYLGMKELAGDTWNFWYQKKC